MPPAGRAVRRIVDAAWAGGAMPIVVVAADPDGRIAAALEGSPAVVVDPGRASGVADLPARRRGGASAVQETSAVLLWPGRMTWADPETVTSLIEAHGRSPAMVTRPRRAGQAGWPVLLPHGAGSTPCWRAPAAIASTEALREPRGGHRWSWATPAPCSGARSRSTTCPTTPGPRSRWAGHHPSGARAAARPSPSSTRRRAELEAAAPAGQSLGRRPGGLSARPSSSSWSACTGEGASSIRSEPDGGLGEGHDLADVGLVGEQRDPAVDAEGDAAVRRCAVLEGLEDAAELVLLRLGEWPMQRERASRASRACGSGPSRRRAPSR